MTTTGKPTDVRIIGTQLYLLPVKTRMPIKFGPEVFTEATYARVSMTVQDHKGHKAQGWGETPLSIQWCWPSSLSYAHRHERLIGLCQRLTEEWAEFEVWGHPLEIGSDFLDQKLTSIRADLNSGYSDEESLPYLAALVSSSPFDIALYDAYGRLHQRDIYQTYSEEFLNRDLASYLIPAKDRHISFANRYPQEFLVKTPPKQLVAWHLVGGLDPLTAEDLTGDEPHDGYPVLLTDWIARDGLECLKIKLRGNDAAWDYERLVRVGRLAIQHGVTWLTADFNCTVSEPQYVTAILDRLRDEEPRIYGMLLYVEQPFPYDLERHAIDARSVAARKPVFLDESATTGGTCDWGGNWAGRAWHSRPAKRKPGRFSACAGPRPTGCL